ncbi:MAG: hypothetical protein PHU85_11595 [Phycisphaerae bacterium]|nr:hypothetical protein [Phycisphaerae bacterium]
MNPETRHPRTLVSGIPRRLRSLLCLAVVALALCTGAPILAQTTAPDPAKANIHMAGPAVAKAMMDDLAVECFAKSGTMAASIDYLRIDSPNTAAGSLVSGRDMVLTSGKITEKDRSGVRDGWKALAPQEYILGARALAVVVHARNSIDSLTMDQLQSVFSAKTADWRVLGGENRAIHRCGLPAADPLSVLFHDKVLSAGKCNMLLRKKDSADALATLAGDPQAIAFVDAVTAAAAGGSVKIVAIGDGQAAALPNAQTIKDGTYGLATTLMLYISPKASGPASQLAQYILSGQGDAICRKHGYMPTLRSVRADAMAAFEKLYGEQIKGVKATPDPADDIALAEQILQGAKTGKLNIDLVATMCEVAFDLAFNASGGETVAFQAVHLLANKCPDMRFDAALKQAALCERAYKASNLRANGERLLDALMSAGDLGTSAHSFAEAADAWSRALAVAEQMNSTRAGAIKARMPAFVARRDSLRGLATLLADLQDKPQDVALRTRTIQACLVELDDPAEAARHLDAAVEETYKTNIPLAAGPAEKLSEDAALTLGEWYAGLEDKAGVGGKELMTARARGYYARFFTLHKDREDALAMRALLGIQKVGGKVPDPAVATGPGVKPPPPPPARPIENITDLRLAEFVSSNPDATRVSRQEIGGAQQLTDLRPLARLGKLTSLELVGAENVKDLSPLGKLTSLTSVTLTGLSCDSVAGISSLSNLTALDLSGAKTLADLSPVGRLAQLRMVNLSDCVKVANLAPLSQLTALTSVNLSGCEAVRDLGPLEKLAKTLAALNLNGCAKVTDVQVLPKLTKLKTVDLRGCGVSGDDMEWLYKHMPDCKITPAPPKPPTG